MASRLDYEADSGQQAKVLLLWAKHWQPVCRLCANVAREVCAYLHRRNHIIGLLERKIVLFDISQRSFQSAVLSMKIPSCCVHSNLTANSILIVGFGNKSVHSLRFPDLKFAPLSDMSEDRSSPGLIRCGAFLYVFGGYSVQPSSLLSSERYTISAGVWETLPNMRYGKSHFCPVLHKRRVFLPAFRLISALESFDVETLTFTTHCQLPSVNYTSVAVAVDNEIVWLTYRRTYRVSLGDNIAIREGHNLGSISAFMLTGSTPIVVGREVWFVLVEGHTVVKYHAGEHAIHQFTESGLPAGNISKRYR